MSTELLQGLASVQIDGTNVKLENGYLLFTGYKWPTATVQYIPISDCTNTFQYDIEYESDAGNYFYIGIERYNEDKATGSNACTIYQVATNNTAKARQRIRGTVNLNAIIANDKKTAYIRLRILNQWTGSSGTGVTAKIYRISLKEIPANQSSSIGPSILKNGQLKTNSVYEGFSITSFGKSNVVETDTLYEY